VHQAILPGAHTPLAGVRTSIFTAASLQYFSLAFLESYCLFLFLVATFFCLDSMTWNSSAPSNRVASSSSTSSWSHWRYSIILFFLSSFSTTFCLGFGLCFSSGFLSYMLCMTGFCCLLQSKEKLLFLLMLSLHLTALLLEHFSIVLGNIRVGGGRHNNTETRAKNFLFCLYIVDLGTITEFSDKLNRTSNRTSKAKS